MNIKIKQLYNLVVLLFYIAVLLFIRVCYGQNEYTIKLCDDNIIKTYTIEHLLSGYDISFEFIPEPYIVSQTDNTIVVKWDNIGTYTLIAKYISNNYYCSSESKILINIVDCPITTFYIPNSFSPNGDGINDIFQPKGHNILEYNLLIYNRWGELIFESNNILYGWDGYYKDYIVQDDVYVYYIVYKGIDYKVNHLYGKITLIK
jgi:gliding motility-associated-like protein